MLRPYNAVPRRPTPPHAHTLNAHTLNAHTLNAHTLNAHIASRRIDPHCGRTRRFARTSLPAPVRAIGNGNAPHPSAMRGVARDKATVRLTA
jgi:hypothetical protein